MLDVTIAKDRIRFGRFFSVGFQRTLRIPDDGTTYPLPPGLGNFPIRRVADYASRVPEEWRGHGGVFLPMYQREALWISFTGQHWHPSAVQVGVGKVNAVSGQPWDGTLRSEEDGGQNYLVAPPQPWLDGINAGEGFIKQFVAMPLGMGYTVEGQVSGTEEHGGLQIQCFDAKAGRFSDEAPVHARREGMDFLLACESAPRAASMGLAAGGRMRQSIRPDEYGVDTWDPENVGRVFVHLVNSEMWRDITGEPAPRTPVDVHAYTSAGLPWFSIYEGDGDVAAPEALTCVPPRPRRTGSTPAVKTVAESDAEHGFTNQQDDTPVHIDPTTVVDVAGQKPGAVTDGTW